MHTSKNLDLKRTMARIALDKGTLTKIQYDKIVDEINQLDEKRKYDEKLKGYRINDAKEHYKRIGKRRLPRNLLPDENFNYKC